MTLTEYYTVVYDRRNWTTRENQIFKKKGRDAIKILKETGFSRDFFKAPREVRYSTNEGVLAHIEKGRGPPYSPFEKTRILPERITITIEGAPEKIPKKTKSKLREWALVS